MRHRLAFATTSGTAFSAGYEYGKAGRLKKANVGVGAGAMPGSEIKARNVDYCYAAANKKRVVAGPPIDSGMIENAHRHVLPTRMKFAGQHWDHVCGDRLAQLRAAQVLCGHSNDLRRHFSHQAA